MIKWIVKTFPNVKIINFIRHPVPTALSQVKGMYGNNSKFEYNEEVHNKLYLKHEVFLNSLSSPIEKYTAYWFIHNLFLDDIVLNENILVLKYEDFLLDNKFEMGNVLKYLNVDFNLDKLLLGVSRSKTDWDSDFKQDPSVQINKWKTELLNDDLNNLNRIFEYFDCGIYSL
jgi:hypothetical protein